MHKRIIIIRRTNCIRPSLDIEITNLFRLDVVVDNVDVGFTVRSGVFVVEAEAVQDFVHYCAGVVEAVGAPKEDVLLAALVADVGEAAEVGELGGYFRSFLRLLF